MNDDPRFILHIGRHKSGTSSLQKFLHINQAELKAQGFLYPNAGRGERIAHHALATAFAKPRKQTNIDTRTASITLEEFQRDLAQEIRNWQGTVVLSSEAFQNVAPGPLAQLFAPQRTKVVVYLREQAEYLVSAYQQRVQATQFSGTLLEYRHDFGAADYARFLKRWAEVFGADQLIVARYDRAQLLDGDIIHDFCHRTGIPLLTNPPEEDQNPSIGGALLEIKRISNALNLQAVHSGQVYNIYRHVALGNKRFRIKSVLPESTVVELRQSAVASNAEVAQQFFQGQALFKFKPTMDKADALPASELCQAVGQLLAQNAKYGTELLERLIQAGLPDATDLDAAIQRISTRLAAGEAPPRLVQALRKLHHPETGAAWAWNTPIRWNA